MTGRCWSNFGQSGAGSGLLHSPRYKKNVLRLFLFSFFEFSHFFLSMDLY